MSRIVFLLSLLTALLLLPSQLVWAEDPAVEMAVAAEDSGEEAAEPPLEERQFNTFLTKLSPDESLYFVMGSRESLNAKFQFSFKYAFMNPQGAVSKKAPFFSHVFFGYTQTSLWDLESESKPFYDTSYRPSLFYRKESLHRSTSGRFKMWGQAGIEHESNGQGGDESRSLNIVYIRPAFEFDGVLGGGHLSVVPRIWAYIGDLSDNPDIARYRGYGDLRVAYTGRAEDWQIAATLRIGTSGKTSVQFDATYPMDRILSRTFDAYLYAQYFDGWGESLRSYDQHLPWQIRIGIAVVR
ncbi:MAG: phospholipase A [Thermoanaerobaculales bacterium]|nr:phospholipase A [Thermoanaerobaculales bacterium]